MSMPQVLPASGYGKGSQQATDGTSGGSGVTVGGTATPSRGMSTSLALPVSDGFSGGSVVNPDGGGGRDDNEGEQPLDVTGRRNRRRRFGGGGGGGGSPEGAVLLPAAPISFLPADDGICDHFEDGLANWTFSDFGTSTHDTTILEYRSSSHSLALSLATPAIGNGVQFFRDVTAALVANIFSLHFWVKPTSHLVADVIIDGDFLFKLTFSIGANMLIDLSGPPFSFDTGLRLTAGIWNEVILKLNKSTGRYVSIQLNNSPLVDLSAYDDGVGGQLGIIEPLFRFFSDGNVVTEYIDDICLEPLA